MPRDLERAYRAARAARPTYPEVGATRERPLPAGYHQLRRRLRLGRGQEVFDRAATAVFTWRGQRGAGLGVHPGEDAATGGTVLLTPRPGRLRLPGPVIPCRVVWTAREPDRAGFAYGSLPGHPECGEESFTVLRDGEGTVWFEVTAFSRPAAWYTRLAGPVGRWVQRLAAGRYLRAVAAAAREP